MDLLERLLEVLLGPHLTGPLLIGLFLFPDHIRSIAPPQLHGLLFSSRFSLILKILLSVASLSKLNNYFSRRAANNFVTDKTWNWSKEIVVITGASSGIGASLANKLANRGIKVINLDLKAPKESSPNITFIKTNITSTTEISKAAAQIRSQYGSPTVLINNAGIGTCATILEGDERGIEQTFNVNIISHFKTVREFLPDMVKNDHGHVVTIASFASYVVNTQNVDYACSKAAALAFHEGLGSELRNRYGAKRVRTSVVNPSWVATPLTIRLAEHPDWKNPFLEAEDVAEVIVQQVLSGEGGQIILPKVLRFLTSLRGWPAWAQYLVLNFVSMDLAIMPGEGYGFVAS